MSHSIVVVDDEPHVTQMVTDSPQSDGYEVITAATGAEALAEVTSSHPWLLILGETLTDMAGHRLLQLIARDIAAGARLSIIMLLRPYSGGGFGRWAEFGEAARMPDMYLSKPFNPLQAV